MIMVQRTPEPVADRPLQELAEAVGVVVVAAAWEALELALELREPGCIAGKQDTSLLDRSTGCPKPDLLVFMGHDGAERGPVGLEARWTCSSSWHMALTCHAGTNLSWPWCSVAKERQTK
jgi:hypothetical protein